MKYVPVNEEFEVNTYTDDYQGGSAIAPLTDGGFVIVWNSHNQDGWGSGIFGQRYDASGRAAGGEFQVNSTIDWDQSSPDVISLEDGGFFVCWNGERQDSFGDGVFGQRYDQSGTPIGGEIQINTSTDENEQYPDATSLSDGGFLVTWSRAATGITGQKFDAEGIAVGAEFQISTWDRSGVHGTSVAALDGGGFVATWTSYYQDGDEYGIFGQRFDASGNAAGGEFQINTSTDNDQNSSTVVPLEDGGFAVVWDSYHQDEYQRGIFGQIFDAEGQKIGAEFQISTRTEDQAFASASSLLEGGFIVSWGNVARRYDSVGTPLGDEFAFGGSDQGSPSVTSLADESIVISWSNWDPDALSYDIYARQFALNSEPTGEVTISGVVEQGQTLEANTATIADADGLSTFHFQWFRDGEPIRGAKNQSYTLGRSDVGSEIFAKVSYADGAGVDHALISAATAIVKGELVLIGDGFGNSLSGGGYNDTLKGNGGDDTLYGRKGADTLVGGQGDDLAYGGAGNDVIKGNSGTDQLSGMGGNDLVLGGTSDDILLGLGGADTLSGGGGSDLVSGGNGNDTLSGGNGHDTLLGGNGADTLAGGAGRDLVQGQKGNDVLEGGGGRDTFAFNRGDGSDTITDFQLGIDHIQIGRGASRLGQLDFEQVGDDVLVSFRNVEIMVENTAVDDLAVSDHFLFV